MSSRKQTLLDIYTQAGGSNIFGNIDGSLIIRQRAVPLASKLTERLKAKVMNELYQEDMNLGKEEILADADGVQYDTIVIGGGKRKFETTARSFYLQTGDRFIIPTIESTVRILGEVYNPNVIMYDKQLTMKKYIAMAGGMTETARMHNVFVVYQNGRSAKTRHPLLIFRVQPKVKPGCQIIVPSKIKEDNDPYPMSSTERITMYSVMASTLSSVAFVISQILK
jgi:protein involved in polysaccharide export with SLBB domain